MRLLIFLSCLALLAACGDPQPATTSSPATDSSASPASNVVAELSGVWAAAGDGNIDEGIAEGIGGDIMVLADDGSLHWLDLDTLQGQRWSADDGLLTLHSIARRHGNAETQVFDFQLSGDQLVLTASSGDDEASEQTWRRVPGGAASVAGELRLPDGHQPPPQAILAISLEKASSESGVDGAIQRHVAPLASALADSQATAIPYRLYYDPAAREDDDILHIQASIIVDGTRYYGAREPVPPTPVGEALILELAPMGPGRSNGTSAP
ncbi:MAG: hypothetical protein LAT61_03550 [Alcanivorax sp.]|nr:hypothetical protein [Alcanivorax sp.]